MTQASSSFDGALQQARESYGQAAEEMRREQDALASIGGLMVELAEQNLQLHRQSMAILDAVRRDLEQVKQQLKRIIIART